MTLCTSIHTHTHTIYENLYKHKQCNNNHSWVTFKWKTFKNMHNRLDLLFHVPFKPSKMRVLTYVRQSLLNFFSQPRHVWQIRIAKNREILKIESEVFIYEQKKSESFENFYPSLFLYAAVLSQIFCYRFAKYIFATGSQNSKKIILLRRKF